MKNLNLVKYFELNKFEKLFYDKIEELGVENLVETNGELIFEYTVKYFRQKKEEPKNVYQVLRFALDNFLDKLDNLETLDN